jgi:hypothetical protein
MKSNWLSNAATLLFGFVESAMPDLLLAAAALEDMALMLGITEKSIASVVRRFHADLRAAATLGFTTSGSVLADVRRIVKDGVGDAYVQGLE